MKRKFLFASLMLMGASLVTNAQGYKDGIEYYKVDKLDNAKELLVRNLNAASTDKAEAYYYLGQIALHQGNVAEAAANFEKGIAANAMNPYNYVGQAAIALKNGGEVKSLLENNRGFLDMMADAIEEKGYLIAEDICSLRKASGM